MNKSLQLVDKVFSLWEESTGPNPVEMSDDLHTQIMNMIPTMEPGMKSEFDAFVQWLGAQRYGLSGTTEEILNMMHPFQLQLILQKFKTPAISPKM